MQKQLTKSAFSQTEELFGLHLNEKPLSDAGKIKILRLPEVMSRVGLKRSSIYRRIWGGDFPKPVSLGARAVGWFEHEVDAWLIERVQTRSRTDMIA